MSTVHSVPTLFHRRRLSLGLLLGLLICISTAPAAANAAAGPRWHVAAVAVPTNFKPGSTSPAQPNASEATPMFTTSFTNTGGGSSHGPITITDVLPPGVTPAAATGPEVRTAAALYQPCAAPVGQTITCVVEEEIPPGYAIQIAVPVDVSPSASGQAANQVEIVGGEAAPASGSVTTAITDASPSFDFLAGPNGLSAEATGEDGLTALTAGSHPFSLLLEAGFTSYLTSKRALLPIEAPKRLAFQLPPGVVVNPQQPAKLCSEAELILRNQGVESGCPPESEVGEITIASQLVGYSPVSLPLFDMQPPPGVPAEFAFNLLGTIVHIRGSVDGGFHLTASSSDIVNRVAVLGIRTVLWGNPSDPRHDEARRGAACSGGCSVAPVPVPFLTMPTSCSEAPHLASGVESWEGGSASASAPLFETEGGGAAKPEACNALAFEPTIESKATTNLADNPTGLEFSIHQPQNETMEGRATAALKDATVTLPEEVTVNPAGGNGLGSCTEQQMGYQPEAGKIRFATTPQSCPDAAKVGTVEADTALLKEPLPGSIYVAKPFDNPFGSMLSIYLALESPREGIVTKLAGKVEPDPQTGRLTATFTENPQLPIEDIRLHFFNGPTAALKTPIACGRYTTTSTLTPWSTPEGADVHPSDSFQTTAAAAGSGPCPASEAAAPKTVNFSAGTESPLSGAYSPFTLRLARPDGSQHITGIDTTLPEGLVGKLAGISYCPEAAIDLAKSREAPEKGKEEIASPSCPAASEVGTVQVTAGAGISPIPVSGHAYLAGPYKGAPLSMVVIVPAVAGPFDLGDVVSRVALYVGEYDARIHAVSDPLPTILDGIPLDVRSIELKLDRPGFTLNPTSCEASSIEGSVTTQAGQSAPLKNRFQVGECGRLGFKPKLSLSLKGKTTRAAHPALKAVVTLPPGGANLARIQVGLPHSEFLDQSNLSQVCTQGQLKSQTCPAKAVYGHVKVWTPLIEAPLEGPVYLGVGFGYQLPALVAELNGQIRLLSAGKVDTTKKHGLRNTFEAVPDAPVEKIVLEMKGGPKYGLLQNSENICNKTQRAAASFTAANGKVVNLQPKIANGCKKAKHKGHKKKRRQR